MSSFKKTLFIFLWKALKREINLSTLSLLEKPSFPTKKKKPLINLVSFSFSRFDPNKEQDGTAHLLGVEKRLKEPGLYS